MSINWIEVGTLVKINRNHKVRDRIHLYHNSLGWMKAKSEKTSKEHWFDTSASLEEKIRSWLHLNYEFINEFKLPDEINSRFATEETID